MANGAAGTLAKLRPGKMSGSRNDRSQAVRLSRGLPEHFHPDAMPAISWTLLPTEDRTMNSIAMRVVLTAGIALPLLGAPQASAQDYPTRPITVILPFAGGSASDVATRIMVERMSRSMGQPIVIDNRPGAGGNTGTAAAAKAAPDGYTLVGTGSGPVAANVTLYKSLPYDPEKDFEAISAFAHFTIVVVASAKLPVMSLKELIAHAKTNPGKLNYGSVGIGSSQHLGGIYFEQVAGVRLTHVPYRNIAQYGPDLIAGQVPLGFQWLPNVNAAAPARSRWRARRGWRRCRTCRPALRPACRTTLRPAGSRCLRHAARRSRSSSGSTRSSPPPSPIRRCAAASPKSAPSRIRNRRKVPRNSSPPRS
jgi:tripartite tricarboxylate transporter family receptor